MGSEYPPRYPLGSRGTQGVTTGWERALGPDAEADGRKYGDLRP